MKHNGSDLKKHTAEQYTTGQNGMMGLHGKMQKPPLLNEWP